MPQRGHRTPSSDRLWKLIEDRCEEGADTEAIDRRIWDLFGETWAVMFTDLSGFSRSVEKFGIIHFLQVIHEHRKLVFPILEAHDGMLVKEEADSLLVIFRNPHAALDCAIAMQRACHSANEGRKPEEEILLCLGIGYGELLKIGDSDVWGREVNAASKLGEDTAKSYEILVTAATREKLAPRDDIAFSEMHDDIPGTDRAFRVVYDLDG